MTRRGQQEIAQLLTAGDAFGATTPLRVLWDFDGVVADTEPLHDQTYQELARRRSHPLEPGYYDEILGRTEQAIWEILIGKGFPADLEDIDALMRERETAYLELALETLEPTWVTTSLVPYFAGLGAEQVIVSNGDPNSQELLLRKWRLDDRLTVSRRAPSEDKLKVLLRRCIPPTIVLEDNAGFLQIARQAGAMTVAVKNSFNADQELHADVVFSILP
ncbi:MAG: HAD family hydrolase [Actinomycetota bacterium]